MDVLAGSECLSVAVSVLHNMQLLTSLAFIAYLRAVSAHGGHEHDGPKEGETVAQYSAKHVSIEHARP